MLQMDAFLNFSSNYFGGGRGAEMDSPIVLTVCIEPKEIDDECHEMDNVDFYPLELYQLAEKFSSPFQIDIDLVEKKLDSPFRFSKFKFTHLTSQFDAGPIQSTYTKLKTMLDKMVAL